MSVLISLEILTDVVSGWFPAELGAAARLPFNERQEDDLREYENWKADTDQRKRMRTWKMKCGKGDEHSLNTIDFHAL